MRPFLYLLYSRSYLTLGLFASRPYDLIFIFIFIMINRIILWMQTHLFFYFLEHALLFLDDNMD